MQLTTLAHIPTQTIHRAFVESFADYQVPISISVEQMAQKLIRDGFSGEYSPGLQEKNSLLGFILNCTGTWEGKQTAYNGGTGVIPKARGQGLTQRLYAYILPSLHEAGIQQCLLEVLTQNERAIHVYRKIGFETSREFICYSGEPYPLEKTHPSARVDIQQETDWETWSAFGDTMASWQHSQSAINRIRQAHTFGVAKQEGMAVGFVAYIPESGTISQLAVHPAHRRGGIGSLLLQEAARTTGKALKWINVDARDNATNAFIRASGLTETIRQYEMILPLS